VLIPAIVILLLAVVAATAYAAWNTIDTDDHSIDTNWSASTQKYTSTCSDGAIADKYEIREAHFTNDGDNLYFRVDNCVRFSSGTGYSNLRLVAGIDCNSDGDVDDPIIGGDGQTGDRRVTFTPNNDVVLVYDGENNPVVGYTSQPELGEQINEGSTRSVWEWQMPLADLYPACRGSAVARDIALATVDVETEKDSTALYTWNNPIDFGDAPTTYDYNNDTCTGYDSIFPCDGPRHGNLAGGLMLGSAIDPDEGGGQPGADALTDDTTGATPDDEDGVEATYGVVWTSGGNGSIDATVSGGSGYLNCWIDWNDDDDFADSGEHIINDTAVSEGVNTLTFSVPSSVNFSTTPALYTRCRLSPNSGEATTDTGPVWGGEVEDYRWLPEAVTADISLSSPNVSISWNNLSQYSDYLVYRSTTPFSRIENATGLGPVSTSPYTDSGVAGDGTDDNYYYKVVGRKTVDGTLMESTPSNEVGLFEFVLTPGQ